MSDNTIAISQVLSSIGSFSNEDTHRFERATVLKNVRIGTELLSRGATDQAVYLVISGAVYQFELDENEIDENIIGLYVPGDWCFNHSSFLSQQPSRSVIKAYTDVVLRELSITTIHALIASAPTFFQLGGLLERAVERVRYFDGAHNATEKYQHLLSTKPELFQAFPLKMIASYLKVAPETISRLRAKK